MYQLMKYVLTSCEKYTLQLVFHNNTKFSYIRRQLQIEVSIPITPAIGHIDGQGFQMQTTYIVTEV